MVNKNKQKIGFITTIMQTITWFKSSYMKNLAISMIKKKKYWSHENWICFGKGQKKKMF